MSFKSEFNWSDVTPKSAYLNRRQIIAGAAALAVARPAWGKSQYSTDEAPNTLEEITTYNNYYEFGTGKSDPSDYGSSLNTTPWSVVVDGMVDKPGTYDLGDLIAGLPIEERIYRHRCVEAWSMIIPWQGFQLSSLLSKIGVQSSLCSPASKIVASSQPVRCHHCAGGHKSAARNRPSCTSACMCRAAKYSCKSWNSVRVGTPSQSTMAILGSL